MATTKIEDYIKGRSGVLSLLNLTIKQEITENDYYEVTIMDDYKYRLDLLAERYLGDKNLYFFIIWINEIYSLDDLEAGVNIKIPSLEFIDRFRDDMRIIRGNI